MGLNFNGHYWEFTKLKCSGCGQTLHYAWKHNTKCPNPKPDDV